MISRQAAETFPRSDFYQSHLDRVSRSFAFCIARLETPYREQVGLSYLLCRLLDTIEDADWTDSQAQTRSFHAFDGFLSTAPSARAVEDWRSGFPAGLPEGEILLLKDAASLLADFHELPKSVRGSLQRLIFSMSQGMRHFMARKAKSASGELRLVNAEDVNRYCFFVAGVVGEMLTTILHQDPSSSQEQTREAFRFGLFLQKVNLLKDQLSDEPLGRYLVPSRVETLRSLLSDADAAFRYLRSIDPANVGFRLFCAWSLYLGLASIPYIQQSFAAGELIKIPRDETAMLLGLIETVLDQEDELLRLFTDLKASAIDVLASMTSARDQGTTQKNFEEEQSLLSLYHGTCLGKS